MKKETFAQLPNDAKPIPNYPTYYASKNGKIEPILSASIIVVTIININIRYNLKRQRLL
jgi:hypothetical protein